jgi:hypothetical protein
VRRRKLEKKKRDKLKIKNKKIEKLFGLFILKSKIRRKISIFKNKKKR